MSEKVGNMIAAKMKVDTGSQQTIAHPDFVQLDQYTGQVNIVAVRQHQKRPPLAKVWLQVGEYTIPHVVAVMDITPDQVLLGQDLGI